MQWLAVAAVLLGLLYLLAPILVPFVAAAILAYICNPLVAWLGRRRVPRALAVALVMLGLLAAAVVLLLIMLPLLQTEIALLIQRVPQWLTAAQSRLQPLLQQWLGGNLDWDAGTLRNALLSHWQNSAGVAASLMSSLGAGGAFFLNLFSLLLIPVAMFYLLRDWNEILARVDSLVPRHWHGKVGEIAREVDAVLAEFLRGQLMVMLLMSVFYVFALWLAGLEFALPIGMISGLLVFIPYLGLVLGLALATLVALMQFPAFGDVMPVWGAFGAGQLLEGMLITPWLVGQRIGLHPLAAIFALLAFGQLFGFFGVLLALPLAAILLVVLRHARERYLSSDLYNKP